jgi:uncharacterized protein YndB with AHSA1/START domain
MPEGPDAVVPADERELAITRRFDAPRELVFRAWTEPELLVRWWGPRGFHLVSCTMDVRPGGGYRLCMRPTEGDDLWVQGAYREILAPERLVFTFAWEDAAGRPGHETLVTITFAEDGGRTQMHFHQALFESVASRDAHHGGWSSTFELLAEYLAQA